MAVIEETKKWGAMNALFRAVDTSLWTAARACEDAKKHSEGMRHTNLPGQIAAARKNIDDAEAYYNELTAMLDAEGAPPSPAADSSVKP